MERIKAIPTKYNGLVFRSKLEAQWAKFFDSVNCYWEYEPEGLWFLGDGTRYMPDFYLPCSNQFFEVKGLMTDKDMHKIQKMLDNGFDISVGEANGYFRSPYTVDGKHYELGLIEGSSLVRCPDCGAVFFANDEINVSVRCPACGVLKKDIGRFELVLNLYCEKEWREKSQIDVMRK